MLSLLTCAAAALAVPGCGSSQIAVDPTPEPRLELVAAAAGANDEEAKGAKPAIALDRESALLADLLAPGRSDVRLDAPASPRRLPTRDWQEPIPLPAPSDLTLPRAPLEKSSKKLRPAHVLEPVPLLDQWTFPRLPGAPYLPVGPRLRVPSPDVDEPIPLPILASPAQDRAALDDPTLEASLAAALALSPPLRATVVPFVRLVSPNPFEHRETIKLRQPPAEDSSPVTATPRPPARP